VENKLFVRLVDSQTKEVISQHSLYQSHSDIIITWPLYLFFFCWVVFQCFCIMYLVVFVMCVLCVVLHASIKLIEGLMQL